MSNIEKSSPMYSIYKVDPTYFAVIDDSSNVIAYAMICEDKICNKYTCIQYAAPDSEPMVAFLMKPEFIEQQSCFVDPKYLILSLYVLYDHPQVKTQDLGHCGEFNIKKMSLEDGDSIFCYNPMTPVDNYADPLLMALVDKGYNIRTLFISERGSRSKALKAHLHIEINQKKLLPKEPLIDDESIVYEKLPFFLSLYITVSRYYRKFKKLFTK